MKFITITLLLISLGSFANTSVNHCNKMKSQNANQTYELSESKLIESLTKPVLNINVAVDTWLSCNTKCIEDYPNDRMGLRGCQALCDTRFNVNL